MLLHLIAKGCATISVYGGVGTLNAYLLNLHLIGGAVNGVILGLGSQFVFWGASKVTPDQGAKNLLRTMAMAIVYLSDYGIDRRAFDASPLDALKITALNSAVFALLFAFKKMASCCSNRHLNLDNSPRLNVEDEYDPKTPLRKVQALFSEENSENGQTKESGDIPDYGSSQATRKGDPIF